MIWGQESGARITVSPQQDQLPGVSDRVVLLLGTKDQVLLAMKLILNLLKDSRQYQRLSTTPVSLLSWPFPTPKSACKRSSDALAIQDCPCQVHTHLTIECNVRQSQVRYQKSSSDQSCLVTDKYAEGIISKKGLRKSLG